VLILLNLFLEVNCLKKTTRVSDKTPVQLDNPNSSVLDSNFIPSGSMLETLLSIAGPAFFIFLQISCINTANDIYKKKTVGKLSPIPFGSLFVNCLLWTAYGLLKNDKAVYVPNGSGFFVSIYCLYIYHVNVASKPWNMYAVVVAISLICLVLAYKNEVQTIGLIGCVLSIILSGSPLAVIKTVISEQSTAALPFYTSLITWLNNLSWTSYGYLIAHDPLIYYPNILGLSLASLQLLLFVKYGFPAKKKEDSHGIAV